MVRVIWNADAIAQLESTRRYVAASDPQGADRLAERLISAAQSLAIFPNRGRRAANDCRELVTVRPYHIRYEFDGQEVRVLRIQHAAQLPDDP